MKLEAGSSIPGGYQLIEKIGRLGIYISTWRARDSRGQEVVVKFHYTTVSDDDYGDIHDLHDKIKSICPKLDQLVAAPATTGLAPWLRYLHDPDGKYLYLVRRYYGVRFKERFPAGRTSEDNGTPSRELLAAFQQLAEGLDALGGLQLEEVHRTFHEDNLFMEGLQAVIADYGCLDLHKTIEWGYAGPRPIRIKKQPAERIFLWRTEGTTQQAAQSALAAMYFQLRSGRPVFGDFAKTDPFDIDEEAEQKVQAYLKSQQAHLSLLSHAGERAALARALAINPGERFRSCVEFVKCLPS